MKKFLNKSLAIKLSIIFFLLSIIPYMVMIVFVRQNTLDTLTKNLSDQEQETAFLLSEQLAFYKDASQFQTVVDTVKNTQNEAFVLDENASYLASTDPTRLGKSARSDYSNQTLAALLSKARGQMLVNDTIIGYAAIPNTPYTTIVTIPLSVGLGNFPNLETTSSLQIGFCLILISFAGGLLIWLIVGAPLQKLTKAALSVGQGRLDVQVSTEDMEGELRLLGEAFNVMINRLQSLVKGLEMNITESLQIRRALLESQDHLKNTLDAINDGVFVHDAETGAILDVNRKAIEMYGYSKVEFLKIGIGELSSGTLPYTQEEALNRINKAASEGPFLFEWLSKDKTGKLFWTEINMRAAAIGGQQRIFVSIRDISERKKMEEELRDKEEQFKVITENMKDVVWILDLSTNHFRYVSPSVSALRGFSAEEVLAAPMDAILMPYARDEVKLKIQKRMEDYLSGNLPRDKYYEEEIEQTCKDGSSVWTEVITYFMTNKINGHIELHGLAHDISDRKKADQILIQYTHRLEVLHEIDRAISYATPIETIVELVMRRISELAPYHWAGFIRFEPGSKRAQLISVLSKETHTKVDEIDSSLIDRSYEKDDLIYSPDLATEANLDTLDQYLSEQGVRSCIRVYLTTENINFGIFALGSTIPFHFELDHIEIVREIADLLIVAVQQSNYRRREQAHTQELEEHVRQRTRQLELANKELETFSYSVSHDLKAPLRAIEGYSQILNEEFSSQLGEKGLPYLNRILFNVNRMGQLIEDLLSYSHLDRRKFVAGKISLPDFVNKLVWDCQEDLFSRQIEISLDLPQKPVNADPDGLQQAIRNLLDNAIKFTRDVSHPRIEIGGVEKTDSCLIWVKDNGIGFDMQYHDQIFEIFNRLHRQNEFSGTGVGLALVRKAMERMGGKAWAEGIPGQGATFYLEIPY